MKPNEARTSDQAERVRDLLKSYGRTYAQEAGIRLADTPSALYQLLVLATLLSARISAGVAVAAARELFTAGYRTPAAMTGATWQDRVDALGRGHYRRYDERTATMLGDGAGQLIRQYRGDLRRLRDKAVAPRRDDPPHPPRHARWESDDIGHANDNAKSIAELLMQFPGIGPAGAGIYLREVQEAWPSVAPYIDERMTEGARRAGLPADRDDLAALLTESGHPSRLAAALVRLSLVRHSSPEKTTAER